MWYFKELDENGQFRDKEGNTYIVNECYRVIAPDGRMNAELGFIEFDSMEDCLKEWGLSEVKPKTH